MPPQIFSFLISFFFLFFLVFCHAYQLFPTTVFFCSPTSFASHFLFFRTFVVPRHFFPPFLSPSLYLLFPPLTSLYLTFLYAISLYPTSPFTPPLPLPPFLFSPPSIPLLPLPHFSLYPTPLYPIFPSPTSLYPTSPSIPFLPLSHISLYPTSLSTPPLPLPPPFSLPPPNPYLKRSSGGGQWSWLNPATTDWRFSKQNKAAK